MGGGVLPDEPRKGRSNHSENGGCGRVKRRLSGLKLHSGGKEKDVMAYGGIKIRTKLCTSMGRTNSSCTQKIQGRLGREFDKRWRSKSKA